MAALIYSFGLTLIFLFVFTSFLISAHAQGIAVIKSRDIKPFNQALNGFIQACDSQITQYDLGGSRKGETEIIHRIRAYNPRLIVAVGALAAQVAKEGLQDIPVIYFMVSNPHNYSLKGENIAGISLDIPSETQLAIYKSIVPALKSIGVIYDPKKTGEIIKEAEVDAKKLGLQLLTSPVTSEKGVPAALRNMLGRIDALWMIPDDTVVTPDSFKYLLLETFENNLPFMVASDIFVEIGALASVSPDYMEVGRQGCKLATEFESGRLSLSEVDALPPEKVSLILNLKTASKLGLSLSPEIIKSASKVYE